MLTQDNELSKTKGLNTQRMIINGMGNRCETIGVSQYQVRKVKHFQKGALFINKPQI